MLTIPEYDLLMKAEELKQVDLDYQAHRQAYLNFIVKAERKAGNGKTKPVYTAFKKFYDYQKEIDRVLRPDKKSRFAGIGKILRKGGKRNG
ncbi:hypothetical protein [Zhenpiania hominis]|uniref:hypothetical protein n=1 Tax=Zhenpiania hominis TaxID=2763644 RepID=UPI0039F6333A